MQKRRALVIEPEAPEGLVTGFWATIDGDDYRHLKALIGGWIERVVLELDGQRFEAWVDEEGLIRPDRKPVNALVTALYHQPGQAVHPILGPAVLMAETDPMAETPTSFTEELLDLLREKARAWGGEIQLNEEIDLTTPEGWRVLDLSPEGV